MTKKVKPVMPTIKESEIQTLIFQYLDKINECFCWRNNTGGIFDPRTKCFRKNNGNYSLNGVSDIIGIYKGRPLAIEVKSRVGKVSPDQKLFIEKFTEMGGIAFVARSVADVKKGLGL